MNTLVKFVEISTTTSQASQRKRVNFLRRGMTAGVCVTGVAGTWAIGMTLGMKPMQNMPSARSTSSEGIMRLRNPMSLQL